MIADGKELIDLISEIRSQYNCFDNADQKYYEALSLVLRILRHLPSEQPCDDAVSRQAAIDALMKRDKELRNINWYDKPYAESECRGIDKALAIVSNLPSAQSHDIARDIATIIENEKDMRVILKNAQPTEASCWGCNCTKMERLKEQKTFSEMVHLHDAETHDKRTETHGVCLDVISRAAAIDVVAVYIHNVDKVFLEGNLSMNDCVDAARSILDELPSVQPQTEWNNHTVACLLAELFGDACACNFNGIDEWLPEKCEVIDACPNPVGVACWEQFLKHRAERRTE